MSNRQNSDNPKKTGLRIWPIVSLLKRLGIETSIAPQETKTRRKKKDKERNIALFLHSFLLVSYKSLAFCSKRLFACSMILSFMAKRLYPLFFFEWIRKKAIIGHVDIYTRKRKHAIYNGVAFIVSSTFFLLYWSFYLSYGLLNSPENKAKYIVFTLLEMILNVAIIVLGILAINPKNAVKSPQFFSFGWMLVSLATFPVPFAYLFGAGFTHTPLDNEIAAIATPVTVLSLLAFFFALASYMKLKGGDGRSYKSFLSLTLGTLLAAALYLFLCLLYKMAKSTNASGFFNTIYIYSLLALDYIALAIYGLVSLRYEEDLPDTFQPMFALRAKKSIFPFLNAFFLAYGLLNLTFDCFSLGASLTNGSTVTSVRFGQVSSSLFLGDCLFLFLDHLLIFIYAFLSVHQKDRRDPIYSLSIFLTLFSAGYMVPGLVGSYGFISHYFSTSEEVAPYIIMTFSLFAFAVMSFGSSFAAFFSFKKMRREGSLLLAVGSFMIIGVTVMLYAGLIYVWVKDGLPWFNGLVSIITYLPDLFLSIAILVALGREYPEADSNE